MSDKKINLARYRNVPYTVNCPINNKTYKWNGSRKGKHDIKPVPEDVYDWLITNTVAIKNGSLVVVDKEAKEELKTAFVEEEVKEIENNSHSIEDIEKILKGNTNTMKKKLSEITSKDEQRFVISIAKEMKIDSSAKRSFLAEWVGHEIDFD